MATLTENAIQRDVEQTLTVTMLVITFAAVVDVDHVLVDEVISVVGVGANTADTVTGKSVVIDTVDLLIVPVPVATDPAWIVASGLERHISVWSAAITVLMAASDAYSINKRLYHRQQDQTMHLILDLIIIAISLIIIGGLMALHGSLYALHGSLNQATILAQCGVAMLFTITISQAIVLGMMFPHRHRLKKTRYQQALQHAALSIPFMFIRAVHLILHAQQYQFADGAVARAFMVVLPDVPIIMLFLIISYMIRPKSQRRVEVYGGTSFNMAAIPQDNRQL
ncbi:hypothetical protein V500_07606 [Pseudogymnoascus sp. VKM F-4518 (FW-2643)]|nr:hypothetical protein V500_07606 [Pseudogymnoascus sp. VKM F-4518 (FW-2643)]